MKLLLAMIFATMAFAGSASAESWTGTWACVVEKARVLIPDSDIDADWGSDNHQSSFVITVSTCGSVKSGKFKILSAQSCDGAAPHMLVIRTSIKDYEDGWLPAFDSYQNSAGTQMITPTFNNNGSILVGGDPRHFVAPRLVLLPDARFEYILGSLTNQVTSKNFAWFTMSGSCAPISQ